MFAAVRADALERVRRAIDEIRAGHMVILVDDEDRENEGDLVLAADFVSPEAINFMAKHARGLICVALDAAVVERLGLPMMVQQNKAALGTAFTVSVEARHGVTTGISAADRAHTIRVLADVRSRPEDLVSPGHVFPLRARPGGVLQRTGQTEGSVDLAVLAGCTAAGVICEIMNDDGTMARRADLERFAQEHGLAILSVADLIHYRLQTERLVRCVASAEVTLPDAPGTWTAHVYEVSVEAKQFLALSLGPIRREEPTLVRVMTGSVLGDIFGVRLPGRLRGRDACMRIAQEGRGVVLYVPPRADLLHDLRVHGGLEPPAVGVPMESGEVLREFGFGAQVLADLGVGKLRLLTNRPRRIAGLEGYGLELTEQVVVDDESASTSAALADAHALAGPGGRGPN
ncbi:MAG: 3,4-dihydroxy-2-butanone-4-phosphate synthase [Deltaproteobacteria bacterium]|nr:3,4-dihydroxy-2-butanone-4-phosphate synthase [Deltaproteobacteria bacterium]